MSRATLFRIAKMTLWIALVAVAAFAMTGCNNDNGGKTAKPTSDTAKGSYASAKSKLSTTAPDAKLLVVQTAAAVPATGSPVWAYLFGSPKSDKIYIVYVEKGVAQPAQEYGEAGLSEEEWKAVPSADKWKVDSDEAYEKALEASGAKGEPVQWVMGLVTYIPKSSGTDQVNPFVWNVNFDPGSSGASTGTIEVDANTGKVTAPK